MAKISSNGRLYQLIAEFEYIFGYSMNGGKLFLLSKPPILKCMFQVGALNHTELFYHELHHFEILVSYTTYI